MPCERHKDALIEAAANGASPSGELCEHLAGCASCRAAFAQEQSLFAAIDTELQAAANGEIPSSLLPRVRARLDEVAAPRLGWVQSLAFASAGAALAFTVFLMARSHRAAPEELAQEGSAVVPASTAPAVKTDPEKAYSSGAQIAAVGVNRSYDSHTSRNSTDVTSAASSNPEVLVPRDEREGLLRLVDELRQGRVLLADANLQSEDLTIAPSEIVPIEVKALESAQPELR